MGSITRIRPRRSAMRHRLGAGARVLEDYGRGDAAAPAGPAARAWPKSLIGIRSTARRSFVALLLAQTPESWP